MKGTYEFLEPVLPDMQVIVHFSYFNERSSHFEIIGEKEFSFCDDFINSAGILHLWKTKYFSDLPDKCPVKEGTYKMNVKIPLKRNNWDPILKLMIPRSVPSAKLYKLDFIYYLKKGEPVGLFRIMFQLKSSKMYRKNWRNWN